MINRIFSLAVVALLLLTGTCLGSYDLSGSTSGAAASTTENLTMQSFNALGISLSEADALAGAGASQATASAAGTELGAYTEQAPRGSEIGRLISANIMSSPPSYIYYDGSYLGWSDFTTAIPSGSAGMWVERSAGWSWYATLPRGSWARELLYVPSASPVTIYEIYPSGSVRRYNLGSVQPGYYYIWFYADVAGRHRSVFTTNSGTSNTVVIDVYSVPSPYRPVRPSAKDQCEQNPECDYVNGHCYCRGYLPDNDREECEQNPTCHYVNGQCFCTGYNPEPEPEPGPVPNPVAECEQNPTCHYVSGGNCYCTGAGLGSTLDGDYEDYTQSTDASGTTASGSAVSGAIASGTMDDTTSETTGVTAGGAAQSNA